MSHQEAPSITPPFTTAIRTEANIPTAAVGLITEPEQAEHIISTGEADAVFLARALFESVPVWAERKAITMIEWEKKFKATKKHSRAAFAAYYGVEELWQVLMS